MKRFDVVGVGYSTIDYLGIVPRYPGLDEKMMISEFIKQGGGVTATAMATVGRLGGRASYIGKVGDDAFGMFALDELRKDGVDVERVIVQPGARSQFSFIAIDEATGKRTIFWTPSDVTLNRDEIRREDILSGSVLHIDNHFPEASLFAAEIANDSGIPVLMDGGTFYEGSAELAERADVLIASALFSRQYTGEDDPEIAARKMFIGRRRLSAVTLGENGCVYVTADGVFHHPGFRVEAVDTTGAGDVFHGAFSYGLAGGWEYSRIVEFASAVAAMKCTKLGGRAGIPTLAEVLEFIRIGS
jgi:ribokinase